MSKPIFYVSPGDEEFAPQVSRDGDAGADIKVKVEKYDERDFRNFYTKWMNDRTPLSSIYINGKKVDPADIPDSGGYTFSDQLNHYLKSLNTGTIFLPSNSSVLVDTGFKVVLPPPTEDGFVYVYKIVPRSGIATKFKIDVTNSPGIIDCGYRGWVKVSLTNNSSDYHIFTNGSRIAQGLCEKVIDQRGSTVTSDESVLTETSRGEGGFGSTKIE